MGTLTADAGAITIVDSETTQLVVSPYETDFGEYSIGVSPSDWTHRWIATGNNSLIQTATGDGAIDQQLEFTASLSNDLRFYSWDAVGEVADVEILCLVETSGHTIICARASGGVGTETCYYVDISSGTDIVTVDCLSNGSYHWVDTPAVSGTLGVQWVRFYVSGTTIKVKTWGFDFAEPDDWTFETTDSEVTTAGRVGIGRKYVGDSIIKYFAVKVNPDQESSEWSVPIADVTPDYFGIFRWCGISSTVNFCRLLGGMPPPSYRLAVTGARINCPTSGRTSQVRMAIYQGGDLDTGPDGATLLVDLGETTGTATGYVELTCDAVAVDATQPLWIAVKGDDNDFGFKYHDDPTASGNFKLARGSYDSVAVTADETVAYSSTWPADTGTFSSSWYDVAILLGTLTCDPGEIVITGGDSDLSYGGTFSVDALLPPLSVDDGDCTLLTGYFIIDPRPEYQPTLPTLSMEANTGERCHLSEFLPTLTLEARTGITCDEWLFPTLSLDAAISSAILLTLDKKLPVLSLEARTGSRMAIDIPPLALEATVSTPVTAHLNKSVPGLCLTAEFSVEKVAMLAERLPVLTMEGAILNGGIGTAEARLPGLQISGIVKAGGILTGEYVLPELQVVASVYSPSMHMEAMLPPIVTGIASGTDYGNGYSVLVTDRFDGTLLRYERWS